MPWLQGGHAEATPFWVFLEKPNLSNLMFLKALAAEWQPEATPCWVLPGEGWPIKPMFLDVLAAHAVAVFMHWLQSGMCVCVCVLCLETSLTLCFWCISCRLAMFRPFQLIWVFPKCLVWRVARLRPLQFFLPEKASLLNLMFLAALILHESYMCMLVSCLLN